MFQAIEAHPWYNKCKENRRKQAKTLHLEGFSVSLQQWTDQPGRFQAASGHESKVKHILPPTPVQNAAEASAISHDVHPERIAANPAVVYFVILWFP